MKLNGLTKTIMAFAAFGAFGAMKAQNESVVQQPTQQVQQWKGHADAPAPVTVRAYDSDNGKYLQGAHVVVYAVNEDWKTGALQLENIVAEGITNKDGDFKFSADANKEYAYVVGKEGYDQFNLRPFIAYGFPT